MEMEREPQPQNQEAELKHLKDALADFEGIENDPRFRLKNQETIADYFAKRSHEPEINLVLPLSTEENLTKTVSELRKAVFGYLKEYLDTAFAHLDPQQKETAETNIKIALGEIISNLRHSEEKPQLHNLYLKVKKIGDMVLSMKLINPTSTNQESFSTRYAQESFRHGIAMIKTLENDPTSPVTILDHNASLIDDEKNIVGHEDEVILAPKDKIKAGNGNISDQF